MGSSPEGLLPPIGNMAGYVAARSFFSALTISASFDNGRCNCGPRRVKKPVAGLSAHGRENALPTTRRAGDMKLAACSHDGALMPLSLNPDVADLTPSDQDSRLTTKIMPSPVSACSMPTRKVRCASRWSGSARQGRPDCEQGHLARGGPRPHRYAPDGGAA